MSQTFYSIQFTSLHKFFPSFFLSNSNIKKKMKDGNNQFAMALCASE